MVKRGVAWNRWKHRLSRYWNSVERQEINLNFEHQVYIGREWTHIEHRVSSCWNESWKTWFL